MANLAYNLAFQEVGQDVIIWDRAHVVAPEVITIGDSVIVDDFVLLMGGQSTTIGSFVHVAQFVSLVGGGKLILEDFSGVSGGSRVYTGNDDYLGGGLTGPTVPEEFRNVSRSFVHVGKHAVLGANTVVLPGVTIGEGAVTGAGSVVTRDLEPWTVNVGAPAKPIKSRPHQKIAELEERLRASLYDATGAYIPKAQRTR